MDLNEMKVCDAIKILELLKPKSVKEIKTECGNGNGYGYGW